MLHMPRRLQNGACLWWDSGAAVALASVLWPWSFTGFSALLKGVRLSSVGSVSLAQIGGLYLVDAVMNLYDWPVGC